MSSQKDKRYMSSKPMPLAMGLLLPITGLCMLILGVYLYRIESPSAYSTYMYGVAIAANLHYILYMSRAWRNIFSYGIAYANALILLGISIGFLLAKESSSLFSEIDDILRLRYICIKILEWRMCVPYIVGYSILSSILLIFISMIVYYTSILNEEKLFVVRSAAFKLTNRLIVFLASILLFSIITCLSFQSLLVESLILKIKNYSIIFFPGPVDPVYVPHTNLSLIIVLILTLTLVRPVSEVRSPLSKALRVIMLIVATIMLAFFTKTNTQIYKRTFDPDNTDIYFIGAFNAVTTIVLALLFILEAVLSRKHYAYLAANSWQNVALPYTAEHI